MLLRAQDPGDVQSLDMTPMIDTVFNLLIFFLVAGSFQQAERELQVALPAAASAAPLSVAMRELTVNVDVQGRIIVGGRTLDAEAFEQLVRNALAVNPGQKVAVRGDRGTAYANVVRVLDICKRAGITEPYLDTVLEE